MSRQHFALRDKIKLKLLSLDVQNVRGLPKLQLRLDGKTTVISGPNGVGKSSVVDAIEFLFTGSISRLSGEGTAGITLSKHGRHIDYPLESAKVTATVQIEGFSEPIALARCMSQPDQLECPDEARNVLIAVGGVVRRGGAILTRKDILRYVTAKAGTRADEIQKLLNLSDIETTRQSLVRTQTTLKREEETAAAAIETAKADINVVLGGSTYTVGHLVEVVNESRKTLGGSPIQELNSAGLKAGVLPSTQYSKGTPAIDLAHLHRILGKISTIIDPDLRPKWNRIDENLRTYVAELRTNAELLTELERLELRQRALRFVEDSTTECPVCGASWSEGHLKAHLAAKITAAETAKAVKDNMVACAKLLAEPAEELRANVVALRELASGSTVREELGTELVELDRWTDALQELIALVGQHDELHLTKDTWSPRSADVFVPVNGVRLLNNVEKVLENNAPEPTPEQTAWDTLTRLSVGMTSLEKREEVAKKASLSRDRADTLVKEYEMARDSVLHELYDRIGTRFKEYYCLLHDHEKDHFDARFRSERAGLQFEVDFLGRGDHPPHALHSEGHQTSMGICLFLALNIELTTPRLNLVILDDVVMSVDTGHRKELCRLIREKFSEQQFIIMTHDKTWARQLKYGRVIDSDRMIEFTRWSVEDGPRVNSGVNFWDAIEVDLNEDRVNDAAFKLRRSSEDFFETVCHSLGGKIVYNSGLIWQLDDWLGSAMYQYKSLLTRARQAAVTWNDDAVTDNLLEQDSIRKQIFDRINMEQWAINPAVHFNNWENMSRQDFIPVVEAFKDLHALFQCSKCGFLLELIDPKRQRVVKCRCSRVSWNLRKN